MQPEIEAKFLCVNHDGIRKKLQDLGATLVQPMRLMRRKNFDFPDSSLYRVGGWVRVRHEGNGVTLAYKQLDDRGVDGTKEVSVTVGSFDQTCTFLECIGLVQKSYQETKRESWILDRVEIELDEWPWVKTFIEIEAKTERQLFDVATRLGFEQKDALHGSVEVVYQQEYDVTEEEVDSWSEIVFSDVPDFLKAKKK